MGPPEPSTTRKGPDQGCQGCVRLPGISRSLMHPFRHRGPLTEAGGPRTGRSTLMADLAYALLLIGVFLLLALSVRGLERL